MSATLCLTRAGLRGSAIKGASVCAMPMRRSAAASSMTPPSEVMRPPSNAAVSFLRAPAGKPHRPILSSDLAGVAMGTLVGPAQEVADQRRPVLAPLAHPPPRHAHPAQTGAESLARRHL